MNNGIYCIQYSVHMISFDDLQVDGNDNDNFDHLLQPIRDGEVVYKDDEYYYPEAWPLNQLMPENLDAYWRYGWECFTLYCVLSYKVEI